MRTLLASLLFTLACSGQTELAPTEPDLTLNGSWSGTLAAITVRYNLRDPDGAVTGNFEMVLPDVLEGSGQVAGNRNRTRVALNARIVVVQVGIDAAMNSGVAFTGTLLGDRIAGELTFEGGDVEAGTDDTGRRIGVRLTEFVTPITLVRV